MAESTTHEFRHHPSIPPIISNTICNVSVNTLTTEVADVATSPKQPSVELIARLPPAEAVVDEAVAAMSRMGYPRRRRRME
jgi:hypothetical protein